MRVNEAKHRMLQGKAAIGASVSLESPFAAEIFSQAGFDFVLVDHQHGMWDAGTAAQAFLGICLGSATPMARVEKNDFYAIGSLLDRGALGIVVPLINTVEDAMAAAAAVRYPPRGQRSYGPAGAFFHGSDYGARVNDEVYLAIQIESQQAVERAEDLLRVEGVDGCWIGPADLSYSMKVDLSTPQGKAAHEAAILRVRDACHKVGRIPGIAGTVENAQHYLDEGFLFVTTIGDRGLLATGAANILRQLGR